MYVLNIPESRLSRRDIDHFRLLDYDRRKTTGCALSCSASTLVRVTAWRTGPRPKGLLAATDK